MGGENIGTTVTSNIIALGTSTQARRAAFAHLFFNVFGVCWMLLVFHPFVDGVCSLVGGGPENLSIVLAAFHTCFNVANTSILIWFIPQIERIVCCGIPERGRSGLSDFVVRWLTRYWEWLSFAHVSDENMTKYREIIPLFCTPPAARRR